MVLSAVIMLVDLFVAVMEVTVSVAIKQLEVSATLMQVKVSAANMPVTIFIEIMRWESLLQSYRWYFLQCIIHHCIIGVHRSPLSSGPPLIPKLQVPLNLSGRTYSYFGPPYPYLCRTP